MALLPYNEIKSGKYIVLNGEPYVVLSYEFSRVQQMKPVAQTRLRHLLTGRVVDRAFRQTEKVEEAEIETRAVRYLYAHRGEYWFAEADDPKKRFQLEAGLIGHPAVTLLKPNGLVEVVSFRDRVIGVRLPIKMELLVTEAPPSTRGNTAQGGTKQVTLETGATITVPLFIEEGDAVIVNTETGEYASRAGKG